MTRHPWLALALMVPLAACGKIAGEPEITVHATKASVRPTTRPSAVASPAPRPSGTAPTAVPTGQALAGTTLRVTGQVFDAGGALVDGAVVTAHSLDARAPYGSTAVAQGGSYHLEAVPEGVNVELVATMAGWTERRQVRAFAAAVPSWNRCDFGAVDGDEGAPGAAFFLADRPEVVRTEPADGAGGVAPDVPAVRVVLSAPLAGIDRARLARALRLLPANDAANAGLAGSTTDVLAWAAGGYPHLLAVDDVPAVSPYAVRQGSVFMADTAAMARCDWDPDGQGLVMTLPGPLQAPRGAAAAYQLVLASGGPNEAIHDARGRLLGSDEAGGLDRYPPAGALVPGVFRRGSLSLNAIDGVLGAPWRWAATHQDAVRFQVAEAAQAPTLQGLRVATVGADTRLELTFSAPMAAYDGTLAGFTHPSLRELAGYAFALAETSANLAGVRLDRATRVVDPRAAANLDELEAPFTLDPGALVASPLGAPTGSVAVAVDPTNARELVLTVVGRPRFFGPRAAAIAARVSGPADPGGHRIGDAAADRHVVTAAL
jgi:hypothetical protein